MSDTTWVFLANAVVWLGLGGCLAWLFQSQAKLARRLNKITDLKQNPEAPRA